MAYKILSKKQGQAEFEMNFPIIEWEKALEKAYQKDGKQFAVAGFRKGKVPRKTIEKNYGADIFWETAIGELFSPMYSKMLDDNTDINPIEYPTIDPRVDENGLFIKGTVATQPEFTLGKYKGLEVKKTKVTVEDKHVEDYLERMRTVRARLVNAPNGHKIVMGDIAVINFIGTVDGVAFQGGTADDYELEIGSNSFIDTYEQQLVGKKAEESLDVKVKFPENYHAKELAGKPAVFATTITAIKVKELPELNDELASEISEFKTLVEWRTDIKSKIQQESEKQAVKQDEEALIAKVVSETKIEVPQKMIDGQVQNQLADLEYRLAQQGANLEVYAQYLGKTMDEFNKEQAEIAAHIIKTRLIFDAVAKIENITITKDEIEAEAKRVNANLKNRDHMSYIQQDLQFTKTLEYLKSNNKLA
ncbi:MAG: trigger factor [Firmicutes bacterium]|nr:trigger factor [Bacillota bacterium]